MNNYYVYVARIEGVIVYVGKGKGNRIDHLNSKSSHCLEANYYVEEHGAIAVSKIKENLKESEALEMERELIVKENPEWNKVIPNKRAQIPYDNSVVQLPLSLGLVYDRDAPKSALRVYLHLVNLYRNKDVEGLTDYKNIFRGLGESNASIKSSLEYLEKNALVERYTYGENSDIVFLSSGVRFRVGFSETFFVELLDSICLYSRIYTTEFVSRNKTISYNVGSSIQMFDVKMEEYFIVRNPIYFYENEILSEVVCTGNKEGRYIIGIEVDGQICYSRFSSQH